MVVEEKINIQLKRIKDYCDAVTYWVKFFQEKEDYASKKRICRSMSDDIRSMLIEVNLLDNIVEQTLLHPCPFCHGAAQLYMCDGGDNGKDYPEIECTECGCTMTFEEGVTKEEAIKKWNTRR